MHIILVNRCYPPHTGHGGIAMYNYYMAQALVKKGYRVTVIAARRSNNIPENSQEGGVFVKRLLVTHRHFFHRIPLAGRYYRPIQQLFYSSKVMKALKSVENPDIVEFADVEAEGFFYLLQKKRCRAIVRCHTPTFILKKYYNRIEIPYDTSIVSAMEKFCIRKADFLSAPSSNMAKTIAGECGIPEGRIRVIPNGLGPEVFIENSEEKKTGKITVLHVGRMDRLKGVEVLAAAIPTVLEKNPAVKFVFIGDDCPDGQGSTWRKNLSCFLKKRGVEDQIQFLVSIDQQEVLEWYRKADIAVVPSILYESFSYTCAQAMAAGLPVIASRIGGIPETVDDGISGILVEPGNAGELAAAILKAARDPDLRKRMGEAGMEKARRCFDAGKTAASFVRLVEEKIR